MGINIAIDGTAGSGKGTISKGISKALGFYHLDTGAMFRSVAYKCIKENVNFNDENSVCKLIKEIDFKIVFEKDENGNQIQKNILDGEELGQKIRTEQISEISSIVSQFNCVREFTKKMQLIIAGKYDVIIEGRDIGTVILPTANFKFFVTASPEERAKRRMKQLFLPESEFVNILKEIKDRDKRDMERKLSPLRVASDAYYIDSTNLTIDETINKILDIIKK